LLGPSGGYLLAYPLAAFVTGWLAERGFDRRYLTSVAAMLAGLLVIYAGGVAWLTFFAPAAQGLVGLTSALTTGLYPFVVADVFKVGAASLLLPGAWRLVDRAESD
jgi:biotin transport system substrate-specific component